MKNTSSGPEESFFKKKGFFVALYSTLGAVMVLALVITFTNLTTGPSGNEVAEQTPAQEDSASVSMDDVNTIEQAEAERELSDEQAWWRSTPKPSPSAAPQSPAPAASAKPQASAPAVPAAPTTRPATPAASSAPGAPTTPVTPTPDRAKPAADAETEESGEDTASETENTDEETASAAFTPFAEDDRMLWPLEGEIVMNYSADDLIYDPTLDQHRTNDDIRIAAKEGTPVKASADGQVLEIGSNHVYGTYVAIDHGNGWVSTYGQLMDGVLVDEGEVVDAGQVIGGVGQPSYFGSLNGTHLNLRVTKEDEPVDPNSLLAAEDGEE